jgi:hypothetical protein
MTISIPKNEIGEKVQKQHELNRAHSYLNFLKQEKEYLIKRLEFVTKEIEKEEKENK